MTDINGECLAIFAEIRDGLQKVATRDDLAAVAKDVAAIREDVSRIATTLLNPAEQTHIRSVKKGAGHGGLSSGLPLAAKPKP